jgi:hypothetical protein
MRLEWYVIDEKKRVHVSWWAAEFNVSEAALLAAIAVVGNQARVVKNYLDHQKQSKHEPAPTPSPAEG